MKLTEKQELKKKLKKKVKNSLLTLVVSMATEKETLNLSASILSRRFESRWLRGQKVTDRSSSQSESS